MPPVVIPATVRVSMVWKLSGTDYAVNALHYIVPGATVVDQAAANDIANDIGTAFAGTYDASVADAVELNRVEVRDLRTASQPVYIGLILVDGASVVPPLPPQNAIVVTLRTALAGRSYRGRVYLPGASELASSATGSIESAAMTNANDFIDNIITETVSGQTWNLGVASPTLGLTTAVTNALVRDNVFDTQRRRSYPGI